MIAGADPTWVPWRVIVAIRSGFLIGTVVLSAVLAVAPAVAEAPDQPPYPDWSGQWRVQGGNRWDPAKPAGRGQEAPLTPEYLAIFEASLADQALGGPGNDSRYSCLPNGMPRMMTALVPMEFVITPATTFILFENAMPRRIYTDARPRPKYAEPAFAGYSIGKWIDSDGDGRYDTLEIETRNMKGPRAFEASGLPLHRNDRTVVTERIYLNKTNKNILYDEITTVDDALTRPWTVTKTYRREYNPFWYDNNCTENNPYIFVGREGYFVSADGYLMPTKKDQKTPDLRYFRKPR
jgi:hypothetical protein